MKKQLLSVFVLFTAISLACNAATGLTPFGTASDETPSAASAHTDEFFAEATSPVSVQLTWPAGGGVEKYLIDVRIGEEDFIPLTELPADQTSFEDFPVPRDTELIYRLRKVTGSETSDGEIVTVTTPPATPNPITVKAKVFEPVVWTPPTVDPNNPNVDPSAFYPPGFDPNNPEAFDPSSVMTNPSASEIIGAEGGTVTVTSPDGVTYILKVPQGAVEASIIITLTPIESIADLPLSGGMLGAVKIEPAGFILDAPATLTISAPDETTASTDGTVNVGFAFQGEGTEFYLVPRAVPSEGAGVDSPAKLASLPHGAGRQDSGNVAIDLGVKLLNIGIGRASRTDVEQIAKDHPPTDPGNQTSLDMAVIQVKDELDELAPLDINGKQPNRHQVELAQSNLNKANAASNWQEFMNALSNFESYMNSGGDMLTLSKINNKIRDSLVEKAKKLLDQNQGTCFAADDTQAQELVEKLWAPKSQVASMLAREFDVRYGEEYLKQMAEDMAKQCKVTLEISSTISYKQDIVTFSASVRAKIPLKWKFDRTAQRSFLTGSGDLIYTLFDVNAPECKNFKMNTLGGSTFTVKRLAPIYDQNTLVDFGMAEYTMTGKQSKVSAQCKGRTALGSAVGGAQGDIWGGLFIMSHYPDEMTVNSWKMHSLNANSVGIVAEKEFRWSKTASLGSGNVTEQSFFTLRVGKK